MFRIATLALALLTIQPGQDAKSTGQVPPLSRLVPKEAFFVVQAKNLDALRADFEAGAWHGLYRDDELKGMRGWVEETLQEMNEDSSQGSSSVDPWQLVESIHDSAALFGVMPTGKTVPSLGLLLDPGEPRGPYEDLSSKLLDEMKHDPSMVESSEAYAGVDLSMFEDKPGAKPEKDGLEPAEEHDEHESGDGEGEPEGDEDLHHFAYFEHDGLAAFVAAPKREELLQIVHGILDRATGKDPSAGAEGSQALTQARASVAKPGRLELFLDLAAVVELARKESPPSEDEDAILSKLGVDDLRWLYASADIGKGEAVSFDLALRIPERGYLKDWIGFLGKAPKDLAALAPRESAALSLARFDVWGLWQSAWELAAEIDAESAEVARTQMEGTLSQIGAGDLEKSLISQIDGRFLSFNVQIPEEEWKSNLPPALQSASSGTTGHQGTAVVIGLRDAPSVSQYVEGILKAIGAFDAVKTEEFQGNRVNEFSMSGGGGIHWTFTKQALVFSQSPSAIRAALRMEGSERKDSALEKEAFKPLYDAHANASILSLATTAESLKGGLAAIQAMRTVAGMGAAMSGRPGGSDEGPLAHLPSGAAIDRHFKGTTVSTISRSAGVLRMQMSCR